MRLRCAKTSRSSSLRAGTWHRHQSARYRAQRLGPFRGLTWSLAAAFSDSTVAQARRRRIVFDGAIEQCCSIITRVPWKSAPCQPAVNVALLIVGEVFPRERSIVRADLSNTGMCGSIARSSPAIQHFRRAIGTIGGQALGTESKALFSPSIIVRPRRPRPAGSLASPRRRR